MALQVWLPLNGDLKNQGLANVTVTNSGATVDNAGKIGKCYSFNSTPIYGSITGLNNFTNYSGCCWVYLTNSNSAQYFFHCGGQSGWQCKIAVHYQGSIYLVVNSTEYNTGVTLTLNTWHHIAVTVLGSNVILYKNGSKVASTTISSSFTSSDHYAIGARTNSTAGNTFAYQITSGGKLNDLRIYDHCLSPKEVKEISKGLVLHYKLDDPYVESTTNIASSLTPQANKGGWGKLTVTQLGLNSYHFKHKTTDSSNLAYWSTFVYTLPSEYANKTISFSARLKNIKYDKLVSNGSTSWLFIGQGNDGQYPTHGSATKSFTQLEENMVVSWTGTLSNSYRYLVIELWNNDATVDGFIELDVTDIQIELKDHATPYTPNARGIQTKYDTSVYTEPDGTKWARIVHHNNPANGLFTQGSSWGSGVYVDSNRWYDVNDTINALTKYEFMVKQKDTSSSSEVKYRWVQKKSPLTATWYDVKASEVVRNTSSGYTDGGYGGLYILNSNTYLCIANASNGNWYGAFGCWTAYSGGIPGYPNTVVTSGYMDLYVRVDDIVQTVYDSSGYKYDGVSITGNLITTSDTQKYLYSTKFDGSSTRITAPFNYPHYGNNFTICAWLKSNVNSGGYLTAIGNELSTGGIVFGELTNTNKLQCYLSSSTGPDINVCSYTSFEANKWYHVVYTVLNALSSPVATLYINGELVSSNTGTVAFGEPDEPVYIGCNRNYRYWNGNISDFRLYTTTLSADDVKELYNTSAYIYNNGTIASLELNEGLTNIISKLEYNRQKKVWADGLSSYTQTHCQCTLTDDGYRIYRTPNLVYSSAGTVMWGGFVIDNTDNRFNLQDGHTYMLQFEVKGQTSNSVTSIYWTNLVGWGGGGLSPTPSNVISANPVTSNYNSSEWKTFTYQWTINDGVYKVCTSAYHTFEQGKTYISYKGFKYGFDYMDTGSLGTDLYIKNIRMFDITNTNHTDIMKTGIIDTNSVTEEILPAEISMGGIVGNQIMEV